MVKWQPPFSFQGRSEWMIEFWVGIPMAACTVTANAVRALCKQSENEALNVMTPRNIRSALKLYLFPWPNGVVIHRKHRSDDALRCSWRCCLAWPTWAWICSRGSASTSAMRKKKSVFKCFVFLMNQLVSLLYKPPKRHRFPYLNSKYLLKYMAGYLFVVLPRHLRLARLTMYGAKDIQHTVQGRPWLNPVNVIDQPGLSNLDWKPNVILHEWKSFFFSKWPLELRGGHDVWPWAHSKQCAVLACLQTW